MKLGGFQLYTSDLGGNPVRGNQEFSCFLTRSKWSRGWRASGSGRWRDQIRALGSAGPRHTCPGFLSPRHPPSTWARSTAETNGRDNTQLEARRCCPARGIICERVRAPADPEMWRRPAIRERAAGVRLRLRAFCALWDAARHQSWFKAETMVTLV
jgi:hypothetical protein